MNDKLQYYDSINFQGRDIMCTNCGEYFKTGHAMLWVDSARRAGYWVHYPTCKKTEAKCVS